MKTILQTILIAVMALGVVSPAYAKKSKRQDTDGVRPSYTIMTKTYVPSYEEPEPTARRGREPEPEPVVTRSRGRKKDREEEVEEAPRTSGGKNNKKQDEESPAYTPASSPKPTYTPASTRNAVTTRSPLVITKDNPLAKRGSIKFKDTLPMKYFNDWIDSWGEADGEDPEQEPKPADPYGAGYGEYCRDTYNQNVGILASLGYYNVTYLAWSRLNDNCKAWFGPAPGLSFPDDLYKKKPSLEECEDLWEDLKKEIGITIFTPSDINRHRAIIIQNLGEECYNLLKF